MYYPSSGNKGADQLRGYREADLRLCFRICRLFFFHEAAHFISVEREKKSSPVVIEEGPRLPRKNGTPPAQEKWFKSNLPYLGNFLLTFSGTFRVSWHLSVR